MFISPYCKIQCIDWFPRMLEKIRMRSNGELPEEYQSDMGISIDERCPRFLRVSYDEIVDLTLTRKDDREILLLCSEKGYKPTEHEILVWNDFND